MINQISPVKTKTEQLPSINKGLLQVRHIQAELKTARRNPVEPKIWAPLLSGPFLVPVSRWHE